MEFLFAPMEGVTGYIYRRVHARFFPGVSRYYAPFFSPSGDHHFPLRGLRDLLPEEKIGADGVAISMIWVKQTLRDLGVRFLCQVRLEDATAEGAVVSHADGRRETLPCDTLVLSLGVRPDRSLSEAVQGLAPVVREIGDCSGSGGTLLKAVSGGFAAAMEL